MAKKKLLLSVVLVVLGLCASNTFAFGFLGPPTAELKQGQWSVGYNYSYSTQDLDKENFNVLVFTDGVPSGPFTDKLEVKDFKTQRHYATLGYGLSDCWEIYASIGVADVKAHEKWTTAIATYLYSPNFDNDFAWGWGTKFTLNKQDNVAWGVALQMNWLDTSWSKTSGTEKDEINLDAFDGLVTVGPTIDMGGWKLYGGPFYYFIDGDWDQKYTDTSEGTYIEKASADIEADNNFGGYIGAQFPIAQNCDFTTEFSMTGDGWGVGGGITWKF